jgi:hypothetical protein
MLIGGKNQPAGTGLKPTSSTLFVNITQSEAPSVTWEYYGNMLNNIFIERLLSDFSIPQHILVSQ